MTENPSYNEKELLLRLAAGEEAAFRIFYNRYWNRVYTMAALYLKSPLAAQDAVQEVFEKLWTNRESIATADNPGGYLYVMARNLIITALKKKRTATMLGPDMQGEMQDTNHLPDQLMDAKDISRLIGEAVNALSPQQKKVFQLSREEQLPLKEVADMLGISYSTAREHMSHALKSIRKFLSENLGELPVVVSLFFFYDF